MCGIFGYAGKKHLAAPIILEGLKRLEYRGYDSWGIAVVSKSKIKSNTGIGKNIIVIKKRTGKIGKATIGDMPKSSFGFGHTRWATHGGVTDINAHPHTDCTGKIAIIHNGIIENFEKLTKDLIKSGHRFVSQTDSEIVAHLIEEYCKHYTFTKAVQKTFNTLQGLNAIIAIHSDDPTLVAVRNGSPLVVGFGTYANYVASDATALLPYTKQVHYLEDNEIALVSNDKIRIYDALSGSRIRPRKQIVNWTIEEAEKGVYPYFMLKEINEQPGIITDIAATDSEQAKNIARKLKQAKDIYLIGCGTAAYACLSGQYLFSKIAKKQVNACIGSEFTYHSEFISDRSVVLALSQSGETMDTLEAVKYAKKKHAYVIALVNAPGSSLYRIADHKVPIGAGPEKGVASTKAFTAKIAHLILIAGAYSGKLKQMQKIIIDAAKESKVLLNPQSIKHIQTLAQILKSKSNIYVIGRGLSYAASLETALKIKEISYIHAEGFAGGELKHGVIALVEKGTPCIAFLPNDETYGDTLSGAMEMKARGGYIIGVSHKNHVVFDYFLPVKDVKEASIIPNVITSQLLAYYLTTLRGYDPDMPRNLAKSVTVK